MHKDLSHSREGYLPVQAFQQQGCQQKLLWVSFTKSYRHKMVDRDSTAHHNMPHLLAENFAIVYNFPKDPVPGPE